MPYDRYKALVVVTSSVNYFKKDCHKSGVVPILSTVDLIGAELRTARDTTPDQDEVPVHGTSLSSGTPKPCTPAISYRKRSEPNAA
jgi:hypothetical protein